MSSVSHPSSLALVTGGASGIGLVTAEVLSKAGFNVAIGDIKGYEEKAKELSQKGLTVKGFKLDVTDWDSCRAFVSEAKSVFNSDHVDVLVNNAGVLKDNLFVKMTREEWDFVIKVNLYGAFNMTKQVVEDMMRVGHGRIINLSSLSWTGNVGQANYSASKAGLVGFTKALSKELGRYNITVNAVAPGLIDTAMTKGIPDKVMEKFMERIPLKRKGSPQEVAEVIAFLASDRASYVTGEVLGITGGLTF
ncbi:beta-ketoacyl-ACP reductase [Metallosphaera tengchongensis]|uniref:Beta-ketoacyl-ACP reductase n=1 Tax=Metallosphaera tengchongensis TaxID=1532350 RepID=A0A6N0NQ55_9CREN|nr:beta-ketoacyl-ACP reductase [Metallosphaera tengchongensis]QKQ99003.1 beta-ketoacyl-ACP reductase [Metallosphaera tengchongensis]